MMETSYSHAVDATGAPVIRPIAERSIIVPKALGERWYVHFPFSWVAFLLFLGWVFYLIASFPTLPNE